MSACEPVGLDFVDRAHIVAIVNVTVAASPAQVWQVLNDTQRWPEWFEAMKSAQVTSSAWDGVGSTRKVSIGPMVVDEKMIVWEPDTKWGFTVTGLNWMGRIAKRMLEVVEIEPAGTGSKLTYTGAIDPVPWLRPMSGLLKKQVTTSWEAGLASIDRQVDSGG